MIVHFWWWLWNWLAIHTGTYNESGPYYGFFSGFGSDLGLLAAVVLFYWKHTCHKHNCYRIGKHTHKGTPYCGKHHPTLDKKA